MTKMQTFFIALADRTRRRILNLIREKEICVCFFTEVLEISQPKISRHLAYLRKAEIVAARREGKWMYYRIVEPEDFYAAQILRDTLDWLEDDERMRQDYEKLRDINTSSNVSVTVSRARPQNTLPKTHISIEPKREIETYLL